MSSEVLSPKQRIGRAVRAAPTSGRRTKSGEALVTALLLGVVAALGIILLANRGAGETDLRNPPAMDASGQR